MLAVLMAPAIWNGFPLLQYDTGGYLARWFEGYLVPSRPAAYGLLLVASSPGRFWPALLVQGLATVWILSLVLRELGLQRRPFLLCTIVALLSVFTSLPWLTSLLLTDIFAGLSVLALCLVLFGERTGKIQRFALVTFVALSAATHDATLALVAVLVCVGFGLAILRPAVLARGRALAGLSALTLGILTTLSANYAVSGRFAFCPGGYGILFGRLLQDGIVTRYLDARCDREPLKLCPHRRDLPRDADAFLWGEGVFNTLGRFQGLGPEMQSVVLGSLRDYPLEHVEAAVVAVGRQLFRFATGEGVLNQIWHTYAIIDRYTPNSAPQMRAARQQRGELYFEAINRVHVQAGLVSLCLLPLLVLAGWRVPDFAPLGRLAAAVLVALIANAVICGVLSNPHDRYGARLIWLAPFFVSLMAAKLGQSEYRLRDLIMLSGDHPLEVRSCSERVQPPT